MPSHGPTLCPRCGEAMPSGLISGHCPSCLITTSLEGLALLDTFNEPSPRESFGDYELLEEIARGGMGIVYRAHQKTLKRKVAIKMLLAGEFASPEFIQRFQREASATAQLQHPNIVQIYEVGEWMGRHFFSMELIDGSDLATHVRERPFPSTRAATYLQSIAQAVHFAHEHGILHRDLKPSNILIDPFDQPRITDFGLARHFQNTDLTLTHQSFGSPAYISPEQARGANVGPPSDIYSLGALLYHLVTGRPPFQSESIAGILHQALTRDPLPPRSLNPSVPEDLQTICLKCLQKDPKERFTTSDELADELQRFLNGEPIHSSPIGPLKKLWKWTRRHPLTASLTAALFLAISLGLLASLSQWRRALASEQEMALNLYAADIKAASNATLEGDLGQARRLLTLHQPRPKTTTRPGFEWRYLWQQCQGEQNTTFHGHQSIVTCTAFSPDGNLAASGGMDGRLHVWDLKTKHSLTQFVATGSAIWDVQFSPDNATLLAAGFNQQTQIWRTKDWTPHTHYPGRLASLGEDHLITADSSPFPWPEEPAKPAQVWNLKTSALAWTSPEKARRVALSSDGNHAALVLVDPLPTIEIWDIQANARLHTFHREMPIWSLAFSPSQEHLVACGWNRNFTIYHLATGQSQTFTNAHNLTLWSVRYSPDGNTLLTASADRTLSLWNAHSLEKIQTKRGHLNEIWSACLNPQGDTLLSGGKDQLVMLWDNPAPREQFLPRNDPATPPLYSPNAQWLMTHQLITNTWHTFIYNAETEELAADLLGFALGFSENSHEIIWFDQTNASLTFTGIPPNSSLRHIPLNLASKNYPVTQLDSKGRLFFCVDLNGKAEIWTAQGQPLAAFPVLSPPIRTAQMSPDGQWLALSVERDYDVHLYHLPNGTLTRLQGHRDHVTGIDFSPQSDRIATGSVDAEVRLFEVRTGNLVSQFSGHLQEASDVVFSPDARTLASVGSHSALKLWHLPTGRELASIPLPMAALHLAFSPDGRRLAISRHDQKLELLQAPHWPMPNSPQ